MQWTKKPEPSDGEIRWRRCFAFFPREITEYYWDNKGLMSKTHTWVWFEYYYNKQEYYIGRAGNGWSYGNFFRKENPAVIEQFSPLKKALTE
jgi:hypothetical protein